MTLSCAGHQSLVNWISDQYIDGVLFYMGL